MDELYVSQVQRCEAQATNFLQTVLAGISGDLSRRFVPEKWSVQENLAHLARYNEVFQERIRRILSDAKPAFDRYKAEEDPEWEAWRALPYRAVVEKFENSRRELVARLKSLKPADFERIGIHPRFGEMRLSQWLEFFLVHEGHHLYLVFQQVRMLQQSKT